MYEASFLTNFDKVSIDCQCTVLFSECDNSVLSAGRCSSGMSAIFTRVHCFLSNLRRCFFIVVHRPGIGDRAHVQPNATLGWLSVLLSGLLATAVFVIHEIWKESVADDTTSLEYASAARLYGSLICEIFPSWLCNATSGNTGAAALVEMLAEPAFVVCQSWLLFSVRARVEGTAVFMKCLVTYFSVASLGVCSLSLSCIISWLLFFRLFSYFCCVVHPAWLRVRAACVCSRTACRLSVLCD